MKLFFKYLGPYKLTVYWCLFVKILGTFADLIIPYIIAYIIDDVVPSKKNNTLLFYGGLMILVSIFGLFSNIYANRLAAKSSTKATTQLRQDLFEHIMSLKVNEVDRITTPSLISRMTTDTYNVLNMMLRIQRIGIRAPMLLLGGIIVSFTLDVEITLIMLAVLPLVAIIVFLISKKSVPIYRTLQEKIDLVVRNLRESINGIRVIKALSMQPYEMEKFDEANQNTVEYDKKANLLMAKLNPLLNILMNVGLVIVLYVGALKISDKKIEAGKIIAFTTYFTIILNALLSITKVFVSMSKAYSSAGRINEVFQAEKEEYAIVRTKNDEESLYALEFKAVSFSYLKKEPNLENIDFRVKKGETLAIIGETGSGKTTIINLLFRFYKPDGGTILVNGRNIEEYSLKDLRTKFACCLQQGSIFNDSIFNNILFGSDKSEEEVIAASKDAMAFDFINHLEDKYETMLSQRGSNLSGGEKQRVMIARALLKESEFLIFDDSSSALDYQTDANLRKVIKEKYADRTTIIVAQRISSVKDADVIIVLEDGKINAIGKHEELIKSSTIYQEISKSQMGEEYAK